MSAERLQLQIILEGTDPLVWREVKVDADLSLEHLHRVIDLLMGWHDTQHHGFIEPPPDAGPVRLPDVRWGETERGDTVVDERTVSVEEALWDGDIWYLSGPAGRWAHHVVLVARQTRTRPEAPVLLLNGSGRGPYECCDNPDDFADGAALYLDTGDPLHPAWHERLDLLEGPWDPLHPHFFDPVRLQSELNLLAGPTRAMVHDPLRSALVKAEGVRGPHDLRPESPLVELVGAMPSMTRSEVRMHLMRAAVLEPVTDAAAPSPDAARRLAVPYQVLLQVLGREGVPMETPDRLPADAVRAIMDGLQDTRYCVDCRSNETSAEPVRVLREQATRMRLVRRFRGRLVPLKRVWNMREDAAALCRFVAARLFERIEWPDRLANIAYTLATMDGTAADEEWRAARFVLGVQLRIGVSLPSFSMWDIQERVRHANNVLHLSELCLPDVAREEDAAALAALALR